MVRAIRTISIEKGHDPRDFALMAFGGAGPLHARAVAVELGIGQVIVPPAPGILCAEGLIVADLKEDFIAAERTDVTDKSLDPVQVRAADLAGEAKEWLAGQGVIEQGRLSLAADMRYKGQNFELTVPLAEGAADDMRLPDAGTMRARFFDAHDQAYGFHNPHDVVELVALRLTARAAMYREPPLPEMPTTPPPMPAPLETRQVWFDGGEAAVSTPVYERSVFLPGMTFTGPAIIEQLDATSPVHPADLVKVAADGSLIITLGGGAGE
jgi:N-methylhydantoinase A